MGRPLKAVCLLAAVLMPAVLGGCGQGAMGEPSASPTQPPATLAKTSAPGASQRLVARGMVLDDGSGPVWCLGSVAESLPPQCQGTPLRKWTWPAGAERAGGSTWAQHALVGTYDGRTFTVETALTEAEAAAVLPQPVDETSFDSPCSEPSGGWRAPDPERATSEAQDRAFETAEELSDYAGSWIDDRGDANQDPLKIIVNVQVTGALAVAERAVRGIWGGSLCISQAAHTEAQLRKILDRMAERSDMLLAEIGSNRVELSVVHDDGSLQRELDSTYGKGLVRVRSLLHPYTR